jgi:hypothetical protein
MIDCRKDNDSWRLLGLKKEDLLHQSQRLIVGPPYESMAITLSAQGRDEWSGAGFRTRRLLFFQLLHQFEMFAHL